MQRDQIYSLVSVSSPSTWQSRFFLSFFSTLDIFGCINTEWPWVLGHVKYTLSSLGQRVFGIWVVCFSAFKSHLVVIKSALLHVVHSAFLICRVSRDSCGSERMNLFPVKWRDIPPSSYTNMLKSDWVTLPPRLKLYKNVAECSIYPPWLHNFLNTQINRLELSGDVYLNGVDGW